MGHAGTSYQTFGELRAIYRERSKALHVAEDQADDLRVDRFIDDIGAAAGNAGAGAAIGAGTGLVGGTAVGASNAVRNPGRPAARVQRRLHPMHVFVRSQ